MPGSGPEPKRNDLLPEEGGEVQAGLGQLLHRGQGFWRWVPIIRWREDLRPPSANTSLPTQSAGLSVGTDVRLLIQSDVFARYTE